MNEINEINEMKYMDIKEFREKGFLQEANRLFFHPLGLALEVSIDGDGNETFGKIRDCRLDPEGIAFAEGVLEHIKTNIVESERLQHTDNRMERLGYVVQPLPPHSFDIYMDELRARSNEYIDELCAESDEATIFMFSDRKMEKIREEYMIIAIEALNTVIDDLLSEDIKTDVSDALFIVEAAIGVGDNHLNKEFDAELFDRVGLRGVYNDWIAMRTENGQKTW
jgi:hypothetical protein